MVGHVLGKHGVPWNGTVLSNLQKHPGAVADLRALRSSLGRCPERLATIIGNLTGWNDAPGRTAKEVDELCQKAGI